MLPTHTKAKKLSRLKYIYYTTLMFGGTRGTRLVLYQLRGTVHAKIRTVVWSHCSKSYIRSYYGAAMPYYG